MMEVIAIGAGGGAGGLMHGTQLSAFNYARICAGGNGGNAGGYIQKLVMMSVNSAVSMNYVIGAAGAGAQWYNTAVLDDDIMYIGWPGTAGGDTSFGTLCTARGGQGGQAGRIDNTTATAFGLVSGDTYNRASVVPNDDTVSNYSNNWGAGGGTSPPAGLTIDWVWTQADVRGGKGGAGGVSGDVTTGFDGGAVSIDPTASSSMYGVDGTWVGRMRAGRSWRGDDPELFNITDGKLWMTGGGGGSSWNGQGGDAGRFDGWTGSGTQVWTELLSQAGRSPGGYVSPLASSVWAQPANTYDINPLSGNSFGGGGGAASGCRNATFQNFLFRPANLGAPLAPYGGHGDGGFLRVRQYK